MKKYFISLLAIGMLLFSGCLASLHPLYTPDTERFESSLLGLWKAEGESFQFEAAKDNSHYKLTYRYDSDGKQEEMEAHLVKLGEHYYLDLKRWRETEDIFGESVLAPTIDAHNFVRIRWDRKQLQIILFDGEKIVQLLEQRRARIKHEKIDRDQFVLTAQPEELQQFVRKYADELLDFSGSLVLVKSDS